MMSSSSSFSVVSRSGAATVFAVPPPDHPNAVDPNAVLEAALTTPVSSTGPLVLTPDQEQAKAAFVSFLLDPLSPIWVLEGFAGCGKSTLVKHLLQELPQVIKMVRLLDPHAPDWNVELTATTNKAAEALRHVTGQETSTIHSFLGLKVHTDFHTGETELVATTQAVFDNALLFIDEASYIDSDLLEHICQRLKGSKVVFIGDPAQLTPVKSKGAPVFLAKFPTSRLTTVVRQAEGNPIIDLATAFRQTVLDGRFFSFSPDNYHIQHLDDDAFDRMLQAEFGREDWRYHDSKVLAWTNQRVINYNKAIHEFVSGDPHLQVGDYAVCNHYIQVGRNTIKTDQLVEVSEIGPQVSLYQCTGHWMLLDGRIRVFAPQHRAEVTARLSKAKKDGDTKAVRVITQEWIDLRAAYSCTVNKAQGSTFNKVFIDLNDIRRCRIPDQLARMLYVAVSRARDHVYFTGDLV